MATKGTISMKAFEVLEALAVYQYLTAAQIQQIGISKNIRSIRENLLSQLKGWRPALIDEKKFKGSPEIGKLSYIYCLRKAGASMLIDSMNHGSELVSYPKGSIQFSNDYFHRILFIDFHIQLRKWLKSVDGEVLVFDSYFGKIKKGKRQTSQTAVELKDGRFMYPDGIVKYRVGEKERLFSLEIHNNKDTKKILDQMDIHLSAMSAKSISQKYDYKSHCPLLIVFTYPGTMEAAKRRFKEKYASVFDKMKKSFLFNSAENIREDITKGWHSADDTESEYFNV